MDSLFSLLKPKQVHSYRNVAHPCEQGPPQTQANLKNSKKLSRSISMLAPWKPKPVARQYQEIHYDNGPASASTVYNKPPRPPPTSVPPVTTKGPGRIQRDKKSASSTDLVSGWKDLTIN